MNLSRNAAFTLAASLLQVAVILVTVPLYIQAIGLDRYGVTVAVWLLFDYLVILNLGLDRAATNLLSMHHGDATRTRQILLSALSLLLPLGLVAGAIAALWLNDILFNWLSVPSDLIVEAGDASYAVAIALPVYLVGGAFGAVLQAEERFLELSVVQFVLSLCAQALPLLAAWLFGGSLEQVLIAGAVARVIQPLVMFVLARRSWRSAGNTYARADHQTAYRLMRFGFWASVTNMLQPLLNLDRLMISAKLGPLALAAYNIPYNLVMRITMVPTSLSTVLFPRLSKTDPAEASRTLDRSIGDLALIFAPILTGAGLLIQPFLELWVGQETAQAVAGVGEVLIVGIWFNGLAVLPYVYLQAIGRPRIVATFHALEVLPYLGLLWLALDVYGVVGAAFVWTIRVFADAAALSIAARLPIARYVSLIVPTVVVLGCCAIGALCRWPIVIDLGLSVFVSLGVLLWGIRALPASSPTSRYLDRVPLAVRKWLRPV